MLVRGDGPDELDADEEEPDEVRAAGEDDDDADEDEAELTADDEEDDGEVEEVTARFVSAARPWAQPETPLLPQVTDWVPPVGRELGLDDPGEGIAFLL